MGNVNGNFPYTPPSRRRGGRPECLPLTVNDCTHNKGGSLTCPYCEASSLSSGDSWALSVFSFSASRSAHVSSLMVVAGG